MVLFVDDHDHVLKSLKRIFGSTSVGVSTSQEAIEVASRCRPEVILLDVNLGGENGIDAIPELRRVSPGSVVIAFTAACTTKGRHAARAAGATAYLDKMHLYRIKEIVDDIMGGGGPSRREAMH